MQSHGCHSNVCDAAQKKNKHLELFFLVGHFYQPLLKQVLYSLHILLFLLDTEWEEKFYKLYQILSATSWSIQTMSKCSYTHTSSGTGPKPVGRQSAWGESNTEDESTRTMHNHIPTYWIKKKNSQGTQLTWSEICACRFLRIAFSDTLSLCKACRWREEGAIVGIALLI